MVSTGNFDWIDQALELPIRFAQVREDPTLDMNVTRRAAATGRVLLVASGGCTACALATMPEVGELVLVDPNQAQINLAKVKLQLLRRCDMVERMQILGHAQMDVAERLRLCEQLIESGDVSALGPPETVAQRGLDFAGRYEAVFRAISDHMEVVGDDLSALLELSSVEQQKKTLREMPRVRETLFEAIHDAMDLANLVTLFGKEATRNEVQTFAMHFCERTIWAIENLPARSNTFLWQFLKSLCPPQHSVPWISMGPPETFPSIQSHVCSIEDFLQNSDGYFDYIHLSNVLDWLSTEDAGNLLQLTWERLVHGGYTLIRQLNSNLDIPSLADSFTWLTEDAEALHRIDRSFFYRKVHLARK
ncbi:MAG: DUF3419 family protein [Gammaproteobacteria bacterium]|nr:DUF3419 family protein [Gammaproteobacteria bacterium]